MNLNRTVSLAVLLAASLLITGCLTPRQEAQIFRQPTNRVFTSDALSPLPADLNSAFAEFDCGGSQNICILQLAKDAELSKRFHKRHDLTLLAVSGNAIVKVEEARYFIKPGMAVMLPRYTAYAIMPNETDTEFDALMIFSPPYEGKDVVLEK